MKSSALNIENNLVALERNTSITSANKKSMIYSTIAALLSICLFRPVDIYRKDIVLNKNK